MLAGWQRGGQGTEGEAKRQAHGVTVTTGLTVMTLQANLATFGDSRRLPPTTSTRSNGWATCPAWVVQLCCPPSAPLPPRQPEIEQLDCWVGWGWAQGTTYFGGGGHLPDPPTKKVPTCMGRGVCVRKA